MGIHVPVLLNEAIGALSIKDGSRILDCTFGGGGHTRRILDTPGLPNVCAIDRDPEARLRAEEVKGLYGDRFDFISGNFAKIKELLKDFGKFDGVLFDFGVSSFQLDNTDRGFSFNKESRLDMRMSKEGVSAYEVINTFSEEDIADIIWIYGNEPKSRKIASSIVMLRKENGPIETTTQLANIIRRIVNPVGRFLRIDAATKTFQAIRIFVNDELRAIDSALQQLDDVLNDNARVVTISFHELEDRLVKNWALSRKKEYTPLKKGFIKPTREEIAQNPRSRSAILRSFLYNENARRDTLQNQLMGR